MILRFHKEFYDTVIIWVQGTYIKPAAFSHQIQEKQFPSQSLYDICKYNFLPKILIFHHSIESSTTDIILLFGSILVGLGPDIDAINGQDDVYLEFVPVLDIHSTHAMLSTQASLLLHITVQPLQPTIPCPRKCPAIIFLTGHNFSPTHTLTTKIICNKSISIFHVNYQNTKFIGREMARR